MFPTFETARNYYGDYYVMQRISEFACRTFSYEADVLDAFAGTFQLLRDEGMRIDDIMGLPIMYDPDLRGNETSVENALVYALLWNSVSFATRRNVFPSWTWADWKFSRNCDIYLPEDMPRKPTFIAKVALQFGPSGPLNWDKNHLSSFISEHCGTMTTHPRLFVKAPIFAFKLFHQEPDHEANAKCYLLGNQFGLQVCDCMHLCHVDPDQHDFTAAIMFGKGERQPLPTIYHGDSTMSGTWVLLMRRVLGSEQPYYERSDVAQVIRVVRVGEDCLPSVAGPLCVNDVIKYMDAVEEEFQLM